MAAGWVSVSSLYVLNALECSLGGNIKVLVSMFRPREVRNIQIRGRVGRGIFPPPGSASKVMVSATSGLMSSMGKA